MPSELPKVYGTMAPVSTMVFADGLLAQHRRGRLHGIGAVGDDDATFGGGGAALQDQLAVGIGHLQAVDHHEGFDRDVEPAAAQPQHVGEVRSLKNSSPVNSLYSLSKVPPVTRMRKAVHAIVSNESSIATIARIWI